MANLAPMLLVPAVLFFVWNSVILVGGREIAVYERRYFGRALPQGRVIAMANEIGIQASTFGPGLHFLVPFLYKAAILPFTTITENEVGIVESIDGDPIPPVKIFARVID